MKLDSNIFNYNALLMFYNNVDNQNRVIDSNWLNYNLNQEIYLSQTNYDTNFNLAFLVIGNTADIAHTPIEVIYEVKKKEDFELKSLYKNFSCDLLGDYYMLMESKYFGRCLL